MKVANEPRSSGAAQETDWANAGRDEAFVQFYETDAGFAEAVAKYLGCGLRGGECVLVIATPARRREIEAKLERAGYDLEAVRKNRRFQALDAEEVLSLFVVNDVPNEKLFRQVAGGLVAGAKESCLDLRVFSEMAAVLWSSGRETAALRLEQLWNDLKHFESFRLFCAYPKIALTDASDFMPTHGPDGRALAHPDGTQDVADDRSRIIALLQRQANALRNEIAERKRVEAELRRLAAIVESSDDAIVSKDLNGIVMTWNEGARRLFGYTEAEIAGKSILTIIPKDRHHEEPHILGRIRNGQPIDHYETVRQRKDGSLVDISLTVSPIRDPSGRVVGVSKIARDISERKRAERELHVAREQLARANETLEKRVEERTASLKEATAQMEEFSYTVSHDLRTPLRAMAIYSAVLLEDYSATMPAEAVQYLKRISDNSSRLDRMVLDVLTYSRVARGEIQLEPIALNDLVSSLIEPYRAMLPPEGKIQIDHLDNVMGHKSSLTQAVSNLVSNAIKFVPVGTPPKVRIWTEKQNGRVKVFVQDNGIGILPKYQHRLFGMFERIHPQLHYEGNGVGLAIVRRALERMGGTAGVESDGTNGSKFWIELPAGEATS